MRTDNAQAQAAYKRYVDLVRNQSPEVCDRIERGALTEEDLASFKTRACRDAWEDYASLSRVQELFHHSV